MLVPFDCLNSRQFQSKRRTLARLNIHFFIRTWKHQSSFIQKHITIHSRSCMMYILRFIQIFVTYYKLKLSMLIWLTEQKKLDLKKSNEPTSSRILFLLKRQKYIFIVMKANSSNVLAVSLWLTRSSACEWIWAEQ